MTICCTQAELDACTGLIEIDDTWSGSSRAVLRGSSSAKLWGSHAGARLIDVPPGGACTVWLNLRRAGPLPHYGSTLHLALLAACIAVQEAGT